MEQYKFQLVLKGQSMTGNSVDAFDVANTILATGQIINELIEIRFGNKTKDNVQINVDAFKSGSLITPFVLAIKHGVDSISPLMPYVSNIHEIGSDVLGGFKTIVSLRKFLKGKAPKKIKQTADQTITFVSKDNSEMTVNYFDFRGFQSKTLQKNIEKLAQPLASEDGTLDEIELVEEGGKESFSVLKEDVPFLGSLEETQTLSEVKYKGSVSKIDTKVRSGFLELPSKRLSFSFPPELPDEQFHILVESMERRIQIYLIGSVTMDFENNPDKLLVSKVVSDLKLL